MIALLQRVTEARVSVESEIIAEIGAGLLALVGIERGDGRREADRLAERIVDYRVFPDGQGKMNLSLADTSGELLLVPQFTLAADTGRGNRASFTTAAAPAEGATLFDRLCEAIRRRPYALAVGRFGANMQVGLINDGPVTFSLRVAPLH